MRKFETYGVAFSPEDIAYYKAQQRKKILAIASKAIIYFVLIVWAAIAILPILWVFFSSFRLNTAITTTPFNIFEFNKEMSPTHAYEFLFNSGRVPIKVPLAYWNSIYTSALVVLMVLVVAIMASFCLARINFFGRRAFEGFIVAVMMVPVFCIIAPLYRMFVITLNMEGSHWALMLPHVALNLPFTIILLTGFFKSLPLEVEESAFLDGASMPRIIIQILVPMMKSAIVTCIIFVFLWTYNDMFIAYYMIGSEAKKYVIPLLLLALAGEPMPNYTNLSAVSVLVLVPMLIIYFFLQRHIIKGLTAGAVKG